MSQPESTTGVVDVEARVRANTGRAALIAGLLIFFGFFWFDGAMGSALFVKADLLFRVTLCLGGLAMVGVSIWSSIGVPAAFLADAIVRTVIGVLVTSSAILMAVAAGPTLSNCAYVVCGVMFVTYGLRAWREYRQLTTRLWADRREHEAIEAFEEGVVKDTRSLLSGPPISTRGGGERETRKDLSPPTPAERFLTDKSGKHRKP